VYFVSMQEGQKENKALRQLVLSIDVSMRLNQKIHQYSIWRTAI